MLSRRRVLGLVAAGSVGGMAGCLSPGGALTMTAVETDADIGDAATETVDPDRRPEVATPLDDGRSNETVDVDGERPPFDPARPTDWHGTVYNVSWTVTEQRTRTDYLVVARLAASDATGARITYEELPDIDREKLAGLRDRLDRTDDIEDEERIGTRIRYTEDAELNTSALAPTAEYDFVVVDDRVVSIDPRQTETTVSTFTYELDVRAESVAAYGNELRTERLVELESVSEEERELVEEAITDEQVVVGRDDEAFITLGERLLAHEPIYVDDRVGEWLVDYEGSLYWTELDTLRTTELVDRLDEYDQQ